MQQEDIQCGVYHLLDRVKDRVVFWNVELQSCHQHPHHVVNICVDAEVCFLVLDIRTLGM